MPAARAGLRSGDRIVGVDGTPVQTWSELTRRVSASPGRPVTFVIERGGARREIAITPESTKTADLETGAERTEGRIGALPVDISHREPVGFVESIALGWSQTWAMAGQVGGFLKRLVAGELSVRQLGGPVAITTASVSAARSGWASLFQLIAFLSINVAVLNMLPIPILDGGQIVLNVVESVKGSPFSMRTREFILRFGLAAMALLFLIVMYNDLTGLLGRLFD
jgi:regulator of sigma E protease